VTDVKMLFRWSNTMQLPLQQAPQENFSW